MTPGVVKAPGNYNVTYCAIGGVIVMLLWFYVSAFAILIGAELNGVIEQGPPARRRGRRRPRRPRAVRGVAPPAPRAGRGGTREALLGVKGVGEWKCEEFGARFLAAIAAARAP